MSRPDVARALAGISHTPFWLDSPDAPGPEPALAADTVCDLAVVGGGYAGLWTALLAKERDPARDVVLVEGRTAGWAASGRNGGFCASSLTHGMENGAQRWPDDLALLERLGLRNLDEIEAALTRYGIDCAFDRQGKISLATEPYQVRAFEEAVALADRHGRSLKLLSRDELRTSVDAPGYLAGLLDPEGCATLDPARLAWGLKAACLAMGVRVFEHTPVRRLTATARGVVLATDTARVGAQRVALATNGFRPLLRRTRLSTVPVYDYVLVTEPIGAERLDELGWPTRKGLTDAGNQFHYFRRTPDDRILWGGYDAVYHYAGRIRSEHDTRSATFERLAGQFLDTFPALADVRFTHAWGGAIDTCTRFTAFFGTARGGRVAYAQGFTGLGVGATRFAAEVMLDLLAGADTERTRLEMVRRRPLPFPPEPVRYIGIQLTRWSLDRADRNQGRRNPWLRLLDRLGLGFDS
ncbi:NAD(P)/FAD-dependent oxidoreductase [Nocardiopsis ansamitocini]|uniref:Oxidoreductase n=1 Tax=Nocardiopsis ansamitocini TaxID=1670832 RepID=A0A9W6UHP6_9ACTN|nr:FAD-dependent oxidoreductase [Nocardiopsis ansamitocini]GLU49096.1 oxidoreductase [Nocardiopsis ansamitocini]